MKHSGKAASAGWKLIGLSAAAALVLLGLGRLAVPHGPVLAGLAGLLGVLWFLFALFTLYFFRDPEAAVPAGRNLVLAPGHGKVDTIDTASELEFMGGDCRRISIFLSVFDVHVQNAPVTGTVAYFKHSPGKYLNAMRTDCAKYNENVLIGIHAAEPAGVRVGVRLIAGLIARRIVPWIGPGDAIRQGERISLIQFGSRADVYLPLDARIKVQLGDHVAGGQTVLAEFP